MVSPLVEIKEGAGAYASAVGGFDATPAATITIHLIDSSANSWSLQCITTDDLSSATTVDAALAPTINAISRTATFTAPVAGRAYRFRSTVNGGLNRDGKPDSTLSTTFVVYTLTAGSKRVIAADETIEGGSTFGWIVPVNALIRSGGGGGGTPGGSNTTVQFNDSGAFNGSTDFVFNPGSGEATVFALSVTNGAVFSGALAYESTLSYDSGTTPNLRVTRQYAESNLSTVTLTQLDAFGILAGTAVTIDWVVCMAGGAKAGRWSGRSTYVRNGAGAPSLVGVAFTDTSQQTTLGDSADLTVSGNNYVLNVQGADASARRWTSEMRIHEAVT